ncbi:MAG: CoA transferase [Steroidobacteraceae bacterium]|jgi:CoA:oxalate CoA-transferase
MASEPNIASPRSGPPQPEGPLAGVKVLDFTRVLSGPYCTALLADLGAEVVKIEAPQGDEYRQIGPFRAGQSALYELVNRNKLGLCVDLKQPAGRALVQRLVQSADVLVENFRPGVAARLGIGYAECARANPRLIYASISGFGQEGKNKDLPAFDLIAQAMSGLMAVTGDPQGPPTKVGESFGDLAAGLFCSWAILAALYERTHSGRGRQIDVGMVDALVALSPTSIAQWMFGQSPPTRTGNRHPLSTPFGAFPARDGHVVICVLSEAQFVRLAECLDRPELAADPRFASDELRTLHEPELAAILGEWLAPLDALEAVRRLQAAGVPASTIEEPGRVFEGAHVAERKLLSTTLHPRLGAIPAMEQPVHFGGLPRARQRPAPALGEHNRTVLARWLGLSAAELDRLAAERAIHGESE